MFAHHKLPIRDYLAAIAVFCNEVKGKSALALSRDFGVQYKTAFVLAHKIREAMATEMKGVRIGGAGCNAEVDGAYFGGHVRPENRKADRKDLRLAGNRSDKRQGVVVVRERSADGATPGRTLTTVVTSEDAAMGFIKARLDRASTVHADEAAAWNELHAHFDTRRVNHSVEYANDNACINQAESCFSRMRRAELGHHHHIAGSYAPPLRQGDGMAGGLPPPQQRCAVPSRAAASWSAIRRRSTSAAIGSAPAKQHDHRAICQLTFSPGPPSIRWMKPLSLPPFSTPRMVL